ncbi:hypothetical protein EGP95_03785 [bacterium]|nr:hypothetical protein [bacterium]
MKQISNFLIFSITIAICIIIVVTFTTISLTKEHDDKLMYALNTKIEYAFKRCRLENRCSNDITLEMLYENEYIEELVNPITKEVIDPKTKINYVHGETIIDY